MLQCCGFDGWSLLIIKFVWFTLPYLILFCWLKKVLLNKIILYYVEITDTSHTILFFSLNAAIY